MQRKFLDIKKRAAALFLAFLLTVSLAACHTEKSKTSTEEIVAETLIPEEKKYPYDLKEYITLPSPLGIKADFDPVLSCEEEEIDQAIFQILLGSATFEGENAVVGFSDRVTVDYTVLLQGEVLEGEGGKDEKVVVGLDTGNGIHKALSDILQGKSVGSDCYVEYTYPDSEFYDELAGKTVLIQVTVKKSEAAKMKEFNQEFVRSMKGYETYTVEEFRKKLRKDILKEKEQEQSLAVWEAFCADVKVIAYPETETDAYRSDYANYYQGLANSVGMPFAQFLEEYMEMSVVEFEEEAFRYAREMVKNDMIFTQLIRQLELKLSYEEYQLGLEAYYVEEKDKFSSLEEFVQYYTESQIRENLIRDKVLHYLVENAIPTE